MYPHHSIIAAAAKIPWEVIRSAGGESSGFIGDRLKQLDSRDAPRVIADLDNTVVVQGGLFEAALFVAPLLIALLESSISDAARVAIYEILYEIGNGASGVDRTVSAVWVHGPPPFLTPSPITPAIPLQVHCRSVVASAIVVYARDVGVANAAIHRASLELLESMVGFGGVVRTALSNRIESLKLPDNEVRRSIYRVLNSF